MLRELIQSGYRKTVGALKNTLLGFFSSITRGGGLTQLLYVAFVVALMAGFINAVVFPVGNQSYIPYPSSGAQTIPEAIVDASVIAMGGAGVYLTYLSGRQTVRNRSVNLYLAVALLLIVVSVFSGIEMAFLKGFG